MKYSSLSPKRIYSVGLVAFLAFFALFIVVWGSWIANIVKLVPLLSGEFTAMFVARIVGIPVIPLGMILGFV